MCSNLCFLCCALFCRMTRIVQPQFLSVLFLAAQQYPTVAGLSAFVVVSSRYFYATGYYTGDPNGRYRGAFGYFGLIALLGLSLMYGINQLGFDVAGMVTKLAS